MGEHGVLGIGEHGVLGMGEHGVLGMGEHGVLGLGKHGILGMGKHGVLGMGEHGVASEYMAAMRYLGSHCIVTLRLSNNTEASIYDGAVRLFIVRVTG